AGLVGTVDLVDNGDGTFTYTDADGVALTFDANTVSVTVTAGVYTFTDDSGATLAVIDTNADAIGFDNTVSGLVATDVQAALDELANLANNLTDTLIRSEERRVGKERRSQ